MLYFYQLVVLIKILYRVFKKSFYKIYIPSGYNIYGLSKTSEVLNFSNSGSEGININLVNSRTIINAIVYLKC